MDCRYCKGSSIISDDVDGSHVCTSCNGLALMVNLFTPLLLAWLLRLRSSAVWRISFFRRGYGS